MKRANNNLWLVGAVSLMLPLCLRAQNTVGPVHGKLRVENLQVEKAGDGLEVTMRLNLDSLEMASNRFMELTPVLTDGEHTLTLDPIVIAGRRQYILYQRVREEQYRRSGKNPLVLRRKNRTNQSVEYRDVVPYAGWMGTATLRMAEDLCGCGGSPLTQAQSHWADLNLVPEVYEVRPVLAYVTPKAEAVKHREESGSAFLDFPVNQTVIYPEYRRNASELAKISQTIDLVKNDANTRITRISIHGYASPEGTYAHNARLAQGRAEALKDYVARLYRFEETLFRVQSTPEDWGGLRQWVENSDMEGKESLLAIIDEELAPDAKNWKLQTAGGKKAYSYLLDNVYPKLRHSDYTVEYTVRAFNVDEAKALLKTRPQLLSLNELFLIAQTYEPGSAEFNEVFDTAVRLFPDDATANLNAAIAAINEGALPQAASYLNKAGDTPEAVHARGVLLLLQGDYEAARVALNQAKSWKVPEAEANLEQLRLKEENIQKLLPYKQK